MAVSFALSGAFDLPFGRFFSIGREAEPVTKPTPSSKRTAPANHPSLPEIFREYAPFVWRALRRLGIPESDVEDVCQEVFVVVHQRLGDFEGRSSLRTFILLIFERTAS